MFWKLLHAALAFAVDIEDDDFHELQNQASQALESLKNIQQPGATHSALDHVRVRVMHLATDQHFLNALQKLWNHPNRMLCIYLEIGAVVLITVYKAWRQAVQKHWFGKLFVGFYCMILLWGSVSFAIPYYCYGDSYLTVLKGIKSVVFDTK